MGWHFFVARNDQDPILKYRIGAGKCISCPWPFFWPHRLLPTSLSSAVSPLPHCQPKVDPFLQVLLSSCVVLNSLLAFISFQISSLMKAQIKSSREQMGACHYTLLIHRTASSFKHASVLNHTCNSSSVPQPKPGAQPVLARSESVSFLGHLYKTC